MKREFEMEALIPLLKELTDRYTGKESTSVTYEKARQLMEAILYCIEENHIYPYGEAEGQKLYPDTEWKDARQAYKAGYERVLERTKQARELYHRILPEFSAYGNQILQDTFVRGIPGFFLYYDPIFNPQEHIITMDYPVLSNLDGKCGIDVIWDYLRCIGWEQTFLLALPKTFVKETLEAYHRGYKGLVINVPSVVLHRLFISAASGIAPAEIPAGKDGFFLIKDYVSEEKRDGMEQFLGRSLKQMVETSCRGEDGMFCYLEQAIHSFVVQASAVME